MKTTKVAKQAFGEQKLRSNFPAGRRLRGLAKANQADACNWGALRPSPSLVLHFV